MSGASASGNSYADASAERQKNASRRMIATITASVSHLTHSAPRGPMLTRTASQAPLMLRGEVILAPIALAKHYVGLPSRPG